MSESTVTVGEPRRTGEGVSWTSTLRVPSGDEAPVTMRFTHPASYEPTASGRPWLLAFLPAAMRVGAPLRVDAPVDIGTIENLMEWQEATAAFRPSLRVVPLIAEETTGPTPTVDGGITAFSGGVDSCFTAVRAATARDATEPLPHRDPRVAAGLMVEGFDITPGDPTFERAFDRSRRILTSLGIESYRLTTDVRSLEARFGCDWETEAHGIWLAAALAGLAPAFTHTVVPSTFPYHVQKLPWGSNPLTDPLLGSGVRPLIHDGAAHDKLGKVEGIAPVASVRTNLRVCWEGAHLDRNCGHCFKCVATQACFWAAGVPSLEAFDSPCTVEEAAALALTDVSRIHLARRIMASAERTGRADLAGAMAHALHAHGLTEDT